MKKNINKNWTYKKETKEEMEKNIRLLEVYKYLVAQKKHHGDMQGRIEDTLADIEKQLNISHPESMVLRKEAYEMYRISEIV